MSTRLELKTRVLADLGDPDGVRWGDDINDLLDEAQLEFVKLSRILRKSSTVATASGTSSYTLAATDFLELVRIERPGGLSLTMTSPSTLDLFKGDGWKNTTGTPTHFIYGPFGRTAFLTYPQPTAIETLTYYYAHTPAAFAADASEPEIPAEYHPALTEYAKWKCYGRNGDEMSIAEAQRAQAEFMRYAGEAQAYAVANHGPTVTQLVGMQQEA